MLGSKQVAPRAGAWIETIIKGNNSFGYCVAPRAGAWIETIIKGNNSFGYCVAPRAGAWIETCAFVHLSVTLSGRAPCGRVD